MKNKDNLTVFFSGLYIMILVVATFEVTAYEVLNKDSDEIYMMNNNADLTEHYQEDQYWSEERYKNTKALPDQKIRIYEESHLEYDENSGDELSHNEDLTPGNVPDYLRREVKGFTPTGKSRPDSENYMFVVDLVEGVQVDDWDQEIIDDDRSGLLEQPQNYGTQEAHFSSSRLVPRAAAVHYPYSAVGKLRFTILPGTPGTFYAGDASCSASVIGPRLILTAGHCVHSGSEGGFYTNFVFTPAEGAFGDGSAPYGVWEWESVYVTDEWSTGGGFVPNAADFAIIVLKDKLVDETIKKIGIDYTGWLGFQTHSLHPNHANLIGYPCNFDQCNQMHQVMAESHELVTPNNATYGSDMRGGSSGGPWVMNFGDQSLTGDSYYDGFAPSLNKVIGVTSWGYYSYGPMIQGSAILNESFTDIYDTACASKEGNCFELVD